MNRTVSPKKSIFEQLTRVAKGFAHPARAELLEALGQGERHVEELAKVCGLPIANTSHHLQVLREGGLVRSRKAGLQVFYSLSDEEVPLVAAAMGRIGERHLAEVERIVREHFTAKDDLQPVGRKELLKMIKSGEAVVIDVRPASEYRAGHIRGAINVPVERLPRYLSSLPVEREVVAYCRGPYCMLSFDAVEQLRRKGFRARRLEDGFPEWKSSHLPVDEGGSGE